MRIDPGRPAVPPPAPARRPAPLAFAAVRPAAWHPVLHAPSIEGLRTRDAARLARHHRPAPRATSARGQRGARARSQRDEGRLPRGDAPIVGLGRARRLDRRLVRAALLLLVGAAVLMLAS